MQGPNPITSDINGTQATITILFKVSYDKSCNYNNLLKIEELALHSTSGQFSSSVWKPHGYKHKASANRVFKGLNNISNNQNHLLKGVSFISEPKSEFGVAKIFLIFCGVLLFEIVHHSP